MSGRIGLLAAPWWQPFRHLRGLHQLQMPALETADDFLRHALDHDLSEPRPRDFLYWADRDPEDDPEARLRWLRTAFAAMAPRKVGDIDRALRILLCESAAAPGPTPTLPAGVWDPCADTKRPYPRTVSVRPKDLPPEMKAVLRRLAAGLPCAGRAACAVDIVRRMTEKAAQLAWSLRETGRPCAISTASADLYLAALEERLRARPTGIRWATLRATAEDLQRLARYMGLDDDVVDHLGRKRDRFGSLENGQEALKFAALRATGNTTLSVLDRADSLIAAAACEPDPAAAHKLRNAGGILGLYAIAPLRNADAALRLDRTLFWRGAWVIDTPVQKTFARNPEPLVIELDTEFGAYIDAVLLGPRPPRYLPQIRERALRQRRLLFVHLDGSNPSPTYIARLFKEFTGNSFTTTRTMLHTDQAMARGMEGTRDTMRVEHQTSMGTAAKYQTQEARGAAARHVQRKVSARRGAALAPALKTRLARLARHVPSENTGGDDAAF